MKRKRKKHAKCSDNTVIQVTILTYIVSHTENLIIYKYLKIPVPLSSEAFNHGSFFPKHPHTGVLSKIFFFIILKIYL